MSTQFNSEFQHWKWVVPGEIIERYGSPHFARGFAGKQIADRLRQDATCITSETHAITSLAILAGNEAYPEAAIADPISDLSVWHDWKAGRRKFPYPGVYEPLQLKGQKEKQVATSAVGVLGEILTGLYSQAAIGVSPVARVIGSWPDFIFQRNKRFHFVEAKATAQEQNAPGSPITAAAHHGSNLHDFLVDGVHQLAASPLLAVWGGFVGISIDDELNVSFTATFLELLAPETRKMSAEKTPPPEASTELARRALSRAMTAVSGDRFDPGQLRKRGSDELHALIELEAPDFLDREEDFQRELTQIVTKVRSPRVVGRIEKQKMTGYQGPFRIRDYGSEALVTISLSDQELRQIAATWTGQWNQIESVSTRSGTKYYRAGGSMYALIPADEARALPKVG